MTLKDVDPLWGLIDASMRDSVNLKAIQAEQIYIPASASAIWKNTLSASYGVEYLPAIQAPAMIWQTAYASDLTPSVQDLSGFSSLAVATRWKQMSAYSTGTAAIMNLRWTDLAANALIGTRSWLSNGSLPPNLQGLQRRDSVPSIGDGQVPVYVYQRVIHYHWVYGIPAAKCPLLIAAICLSASISVGTGRGSMSRLSAGRLLAALRLCEEDFVSPSKEWARGLGSAQLSLFEAAYEPVVQEEHATAPK
ncbi:hypothetical protein LTR74_017697 [Friedmanniomyces endolithicus]|nr:hypothetical protein LTR74_017697 [Friedmanniomyces endolithicus]